MKSWTLLLTLVLLLVLPFSSVGAIGNEAPLRSNTPYVVTTLLDTAAIPCDVLVCSLRAAIDKANNDHTGSSITFAPGLSGTITLTSELPQITDTAGTTLIDAGSHWIDINGNDSVRLFSVASGAGLTLKDLILEHGHTDGSGGIVSNYGVLTVIHCSFLNSHANIGGAIYSIGSAATTVDISRSYFAGNSAGNNSNSEAGAIHQGSGSITITNSTFYNNTAPNGAVITNGSGWTVTITNSTIVGNSATGTNGASVFNASGLLKLRNTIVANQTQGANCAGTINNQGNNLDSGTSCGWAANLGSKSNTNPLLKPSTGSGPSTAMGVSILSPALDGVTNDPTNCPAVDQRGVVRPKDGNGDGLARCDIGAVEMPRGWLVFLPLITR